MFTFVFLILSFEQLFLNWIFFKFTKLSTKKIKNIYNKIIKNIYI